MPMHHAGASEETALEVEDDAGTSQPQEDDSGKWWTKAFSRAGRMGSRPMEVKDAPKPKVKSSMKACCLTVDKYWYCRSSDAATSQ